MSANEIHCEDEMVGLLALIYRKVQWKKLRTRHIPWDIFNHRVRAACRRRGIQEFVSGLCNAFSLQSLPLESAALVAAMRPTELDVLNNLAEAHIALCTRAVILAKKTREREAIETPKTKEKGQACYD